MIALVLSLLLSQGYAPTRQGLDPLDAQREARVIAVGKNIRCAVCQGLSIADSPSSMARAQLDKVRELVAAGKTDEEIYDYFVARYSEWALLDPKTHGINWLLWLGPLVLLVAGFAIVFFQTRARPLLPPKHAAPADDAYLAQVRSELEK